MAHEGLHEAPQQLDEATVDRHRALVSLQEELEAIDWYDQRVAATGDASLAAVLAHNRDEEKEHAVMTLEWLRRQDPVLDRHLHTYLFTSEPVTEIEEEVESEAGAQGAPRPDLVSGIGASALAGNGGGARETAPHAAAPSLGIGSLRGLE